MAETIESFVEKLQQDGVKAGQEAADKIRTEAERERDRIIEEAQQKADRIVKDAEAESQKMQERSETELKLAARDTLVRLQGTLSRAIKSVLMDKVESNLDDSGFLSGLIRDVVLEYAKADAVGEGSVSVNVSDEKRHQLADWAIKELREALRESGSGVDLHGTLKREGFEYHVSGGTVEVTTDAVVDMLSELVNPELRNIVSQAASS
jgi:vacuolar-type H+-ATPase subunit E/Vma4